MEHFLESTFTLSNIFWFLVWTAGILFFGFGFLVVWFSVAKPFGIFFDIVDTINEEEPHNEDYPQRVLNGIHLLKSVFVTVPAFFFWLLLLIPCSLFYWLIFWNREWRQKYTEWLKRVFVTRFNALNQELREPPKYNPDDHRFATKTSQAAHKTESFLFWFGIVFLWFVIGSRKQYNKDGTVTKKPGLGFYRWLAIAAIANRHVRKKREKNRLEQRPQVEPARIAQQEPLPENEIESEFKDYQPTFVWGDEPKKRAMPDEVPPVIEGDEEGR